MAETLSSYEIKEKQKPLVIEGKPRDYKRSQEDSKQRLEIELREKQAELEQAEGELKELQAAKQSKTAVEEYQEKEKILKYGKLADFSYINLKTTGFFGKLELGSITLDDALYPNLPKIMKGEKVPNPTPEEIKLTNYINDPKNINNINYSKQPPKEYGVILAQAGLSDAPIQVASAELAKYDGNAGLQPSYFENEKKKNLLISYLEEEKILESAKKNFEEVTKEFKIVDYYPNESIKDNGSSGLGAVFLEKNGKKYLAIRGTEFTSWADLVADGQMIMGGLPDRQVKDLIKFIDRNIKPGETFSIAGHSLGGALSQIASAMYADQLEETYTFNSPGAKKLRASSDDRKEFEKINKFVYNKDNPELQKKVINVVGDKGISPIAGLGEDIGDYEIKLQNLSSHRITVLLEYVRQLREDAEELKRKLVIREEVIDDLEGTQ